ncbi:glycosyltransferase [Pseudonocardia sp. TRM90224]|uniref:glycosyltransferase n=1 Tax=Pseudonocardia sp. TRM90224 TaxID=2812678 RepID=UPI001E2F9954|nr:glycosyltransferase [Pseudonocardia sp. TRM90224]
MATMLLVSHGTDGDVLPFIGLGRQLAGRGHEVTVLTHAPYAELVGRAGLEFVAIDTEEEYEQQLADTARLLAGRAPGRWLEFYRRNGLFAQTLMEYRALVERHVPGRTVLIGRHSSAVSVLMAAARLGAPSAWVAVSPVQLMAEEGARLLYATMLRAGLAEVAEAAGLGRDWAAHEAVADLEVGLWPEWFDRAGVRSPARVRLTGFPLADDQPRPLDPSIAALLAERPVLVSGGTGRMMHPRFYEVAVAACRRADRPALLVVRHRDLVPERLPDRMRWVPALPFHSVLPQVGVVLHHGGIGTLARALTAGTPQVVLAHGVDRPDNAGRLAALGLAQWLPVEAWDPDAVAELLTGARAGSRPEGGDGLGGAATAVEELLAAPAARAVRGPALADRQPLRRPARRAALLRLLEARR